MSRVVDIAGTLSNTKVFLNGISVTSNLCKTFKQYIELNPLSSKVLVENINDRWTVGIAGSADNIFHHTSFVNNISTFRGGSHVDYIVEQITKGVIELLGKKKSSLSIKPAHVKRFLHVFVNCSIDEPTFDTQTKECLTSKRTKFGSTCELSERFLQKIIKEIALVEKMENINTVLEEKSLKKGESSRKQTRLTGFNKLEDAGYAGSQI